RRMAAQKMALIPTLHLFGQDYNIEDIRREVRDYQQAGGQILFGTDVGYLPDYDPTDEYVQMARAGLTWRQILASLTTNPAARFGEASTRGRIAEGMEADLVILSGDPSADVRAFANVAAVVRGGRIIYQATDGRRLALSPAPLLHFLCWARGPDGRFRLASATVRFGHAASLNRKYNCPGLLAWAEVLLFAFRLMNADPG